MMLDLKKKNSQPSPTKKNPLVHINPSCNAIFKIFPVTITAGFPSKIKTDYKATFRKVALSI